MIATRTAPPQEKYAGDLLQMLEALGTLAALGDDLGEETAASARFHVQVHSEAEVDAAAALLGTRAERPGPWTYQAVKHAGAVTVTVAFTSGPAAPADLATLDAICGWARSDLPRSAA